MHLKGSDRTGEQRAPGGMLFLLLVCALLVLAALVCG